MTWALAIDFGTTTTSAAMGTPDGAAEVVEIGRSPRMPSVVLATESGELMVGDAAEAQVALAPDRAERTPKRRLGDEVMLLGKRPVRPVEAVAAILRTVAEEAVRRQGGAPPSELRLTHPARWGSMRRAALAEAAQLAGLPDPVFVAEPIAAAVHFADERVVPGAFVAVYDLGGGTFDTAVLRRTPDDFDVVGIPGGDERLGGELFDDKLFALVGDRLTADAPESWEALRFSTERAWRKAGYDLRMEVRRAKEALSSNAEYTVYVGAPVDATVIVGRDEFEALIADEITRTVDELEATVTRAGLAAVDLAAINLVGGSSRIPLVTRLVAERFGQLPQTWGDPKAAVALGALKAVDVARLGSGSGSGSGGSEASARRAPVAKLPEAVGGYEVVAELGRGGMGVVYLARQPSLGRAVAVKTLPMLDAGLTERLKREASILGELQHPHIATVIDVASDDRGTHVVMPFFPGGTVSHVLARDGRMEPGAAASVLAAVAEALAATHAKGFLHRDVKPSNILMSASGDPYLADFGLALPLFDSGRLTSSRSVLGTAPYIAPEILADEDATPASDVYALGVTGYQLLTGRLPYAGSNVLAVVDAIRRGDATPLGELTPDCPVELGVLVEAALSADPTRRPVDLRAWAAAIRTAAPLMPVTPAPPVGWTAAITVASQPAASPVAAPAGGIETPVSGDATPGLDAPAPASSIPPIALDRPVPHRPNGGRSRTPRPRVLIPVAAVVLAMAVAGTAFALTRGSPTTEVVRTASFSVKSVLGMRAGEAAKLLGAAGLRVEIEDASAEDGEGADPGTVVRMSPAGGSAVEKGETITLFVARAERTQDTTTAAPGSGTDTSPELSGPAPVSGSGSTQTTQASPRPANQQTTQTTQPQSQTTPTQAPTTQPPPAERANNAPSAENHDIEMEDDSFFEFSLGSDPDSDDSLFDAEILSVSGFPSHVFVDQGRDYVYVDDEEGNSIAIDLFVDVGSIDLFGGAFITDSFSFTYRVFDSEGAASEPATVTVQIF